MEILLILKEWGVPVITGVLAWNKDRILTALNIKRQKAEIEANEADNLSKNLRIYQEMIDDMKGRFETQLKQIESDYMLEIKKHKQFIEDCNTSLEWYKNNCKCV